MTDNNKSLMQRIRGAGWGAIVLLFAAGVIFWGGFNWALEMTNTEKFCISCHEMEENVFKEYRNTIHYQNRTGVRATCPDCHVPKEWGPKMIRKIKASREVYGKIMGTISTPEKFAHERLRLAQNEWKRMKANNSQECRKLPQLRVLRLLGPGPPFQPDAPGGLRRRQDLHRLPQGHRPLAAAGRPEHRRRSRSRRA